MATALLPSHRIRSVDRSVSGPAPDARPGGGGSRSGATVRSVALTAPSSILSVAGSPVTQVGTLALSLVNQTANRVWAGPTTGADAAPTFRALVAADLPAATESAQGALELATQAETDAGTNDTTAVTPLKQQAWTAAYRDYDATAAAPSHREGRTFWDETDHTLAYFTDISGVRMNIGQEMWCRVRNNTGATIANGSVVYISGGLGNRPTIALADASAISTSDLLGVTTHDIANNTDGYVTVYGLVHDLDTSAWAEGTTLFLSETAGAFTSTPPSDPAYVVHVGVVTLSHAIQGTILVQVLHPEEHASETERGIIELATQAEVDAGTDDARAVTPLKLKTTTFVGSKIILERIGASTYFSAQHLQDIFHSAGYVSGGAITSPGSGLIDVAAGTGLIRATDSAVAPVLFFDWPAVSNVAITADTIGYVGVEYNAGTPQVVVRSSQDWDYKTDFPLGRVVSEGGFIHILDDPQAVGDHAAQMILRAAETMPLARDEFNGGLLLGTSGTRNMTLSAGALWDRLNRFPISAIDTSVSGTFSAYYRDGGSGFTKQTGLTQWPNTEYDDGSGTLATMTPARYAVLWFYIETDGDFVMVYGRAQYNTLAQATVEAPPATLPNAVVAHGRLVGRLIFQKSAATPDATESAFTTTFQSAAVTDHNNLGGLQGGTSGEYYHFTSAQHTDIAALQAVATTGLFARTAANTWAARTITGTTNQVSVSNGDGVSGNPTLSLPQSIHTGATPQFAQLGFGGAAVGTHAIAIHSSTADVVMGNAGVQAFFPALAGRGLFIQRNGIAGVHLCSASQTSTFIGVQTDGTLASPSATTSGRSFNLAGAAYDGTNWFVNSRARLECAQNQTDSARGSKFGVDTILNGATALAERLAVSGTGSIELGVKAAVATTATDGFVYIPTCAGTPTGTPTAVTGLVPVIVDSTNHKLYFYSGGAWRDAGP